MWEPIQFIHKYFDLITYCEDKSSFNQKIFKAMHYEYAKKYQNLDQEKQGFIAKEINKCYNGAE